MSKIEYLISMADAYNLDGADMLHTMPLTEIEAIYNGIGPEWMPALARHLYTSIHADFAPAALIHDVEFSRGGTREDFDRANERLLANCQKIASYTPWFSPARWLLAINGRKFYLLCHCFGWSAFSKHL